MREWSALLAAAAFLPALAGCAAIQRSEAAETEQVLAAAGFRQVPADTKPRIDALRSMKPRTVSTVVRNGRTWYVYPDPTDCTCLYVGNAANYQQYQKLAFEKRIADEQLMAAEANEDAAFDWGVWGPWW
jgi:hypothetical protein